MSEDRDELERRLDAALSAGDLDHAYSLARLIGTDRRPLALRHALRLTALRVEARHPRSEEAVERRRERFQAERNPRRVETEIADAALSGLEEPEIALFCKRVLRQMIGADM